MKNLMLLALAMGSMLAFAGPIEDEIVARIHKIGDVCLVGEACASGQLAADAGAQSDAQSPEAIYNRSCNTCHEMGIAGAPKLGDIDQWAPRLDKGMDVLYASGINGLAPGMPARGMCFDCSDDDIRAVVDYMTASVQ
ncbi:MAG: cytochrome c5 family protein [Pseudomonadales bacterium]|jgi:cytochrome c5|nr:cytochrome c5 family protein [Pseudomonadales bacterium]MDA0760080.1 c-type cytochrome [Pseudomonadota bacterium]